MLSRQLSLDFPSSSSYFILYGCVYAEVSIVQQRSMHPRAWFAFISPPPLLDLSKVFL